MDGAELLCVEPVEDGGVHEVHAIRQAGDDGEGVALEEAPDGAALACGEGGGKENVEWC